MTSTIKTIKWESNWPVILLYLYLHVLSVYALVLLTEAKILTLLFGVLLILLSYLGTTAGAHRLWAHKTYVADFKLRLFLMLCHTLSGQGTIYNWVLLHRLHHKHFGTALDPFDARKGLFYVHIISKVVSPVGGYDTLKGEVDMSDIESDSIVMFQKKYYWLLYPIVFLLLPINAPAEYWGETLWNSPFIIGTLRYCISIHLTSLVDTTVQIFSSKSHFGHPAELNLIEVIDKNLWIPYHYLAPWDYRSSELGDYGYDVTSIFIKTCAGIGFATDLKTMDGGTIGKAIQMAADTNKSISQCLMELNCPNTE